LPGPNTAPPAVFVYIFAQLEEGGVGRTRGASDFVEVLEAEEDEDAVEDEVA